MLSFLVYLLTAPAPTWLVILLTFAIILNVYDAAKRRR